MKKIRALTEKFNGFDASATKVSQMYTTDFREKKVSEINGFKNFFQTCDIEKLRITVAALWIFISIPLSQDLYDEMFSGGFLMHIFALLTVAAPVWLVLGWRWLTNDLPIPLKIYGFIAAISAASFLILVNDSHTDDIAYIPLLQLVAFLMLGWICNRKKQT